MRRKGYRILSLVLSVALIFSSMNTNVFAGELENETVATDAYVIEEETYNSVETNENEGETELVESSEDIIVDFLEQVSEDRSEDNFENISEESEGLIENNSDIIVEVPEEVATEELSTEDNLSEDYVIVVTDEEVDTINEVDEESDIAENTDASVSDMFVEEEIADENIELEEETIVEAGSHIWTGAVDTSWYTGDKDSYDISTPEQLAGFAKLVDQAAHEDRFTGVSINLVADIVLNDTTNFKNWGTKAPKNTWEPIGHIGSAIMGYNPFAGVFNGNGHTISGIYCVANDYSIFGTKNTIGLFECVCNAVVRDVNVEYTYLECNGDVGVIAGASEASYFQNIKVKNAVIVAKDGGAGGIVGANYQFVRTYLMSLVILGALGIFVNPILYADDMAEEIYKQYGSILYNCTVDGLTIKWVQGYGNAANMGGIVGAGRSGICECTVSNFNCVNPGGYCGVMIGANPKDNKEVAIKDCKYYLCSIKKPQGEYSKTFIDKAYSKDIWKDICKPKIDTTNIRYLNASTKYGFTGEYMVVGVECGNEFYDYVTCKTKLKKFATATKKKTKGIVTNTIVSVKAVKGIDEYIVYLRDGNGRDYAYRIYNMSFDKEEAKQKLYSINMNANSKRVVSLKTSNTKEYKDFSTKITWKVGKIEIPKGAENAVKIGRAGKEYATVYVDPTTGNAVVTPIAGFKGNVKLVASVNGKKYTTTVKIANKY